MYYPNEAIELWEGNRGIEEYAREIFPVEERNNGLTWMDETEDEEVDGEDAETEPDVDGATSAGDTSGVQTPFEGAPNGVSSVPNAASSVVDGGGLDPAPYSYSYFAGGC